MQQVIRERAARAARRERSGRDGTEVQKIEL